MGGNRSARRKPTCLTWWPHGHLTCRCRVLSPGRSGERGVRYHCPSQTAVELWYAEYLSDLECILMFSWESQVCCLTFLEIRFMCIVRDRSQHRPLRYSRWDRYRFGCTCRSIYKDRLVAVIKCDSVPFTVAAMNNYTHTSSVKCQTSSFWWLSVFARAKYYYRRCSPPLLKCHKAFRKQLIPYNRSLQLYPYLSLSLPLLSPSSYPSCNFSLFFLKTFFICCIAMSTWLFISCTVGGL